MKAIIPAFESFPQEAELVGAILSGYSLLEFNLAQILRVALQDDNTAVKLLYRTRGEEQRISIADAILREKFSATPLYNTYCEAVADVHWCRRIRNQYAHCYWELQGKLLGGASGGLIFVNLDDVAQEHGNPNIFLHRKIITLTLLKSQAEYYLFVRSCLIHLYDSYSALLGKSPLHILPLPKKVARPLLDNGTAQK